MTVKRLLSTILILPFLLATHPQDAPSFRDFKNAKERKKAFIEFLAPQVNAINTEILEDREMLLSLHDKFKNHKKMTLAEEIWLDDLSEDYRVKDFNVTQGKSWNELLIKVDIIPLSMALAQAANESGFGTSRFAVLGNNYFGHFCKQKGCGIIPGPKGKENSSEAKKFASVFESVETYIYNLNSHVAYKKMREIRAKLRKVEKPLDGAMLADGLELYSTRGKAYVRDIKRMIRVDGFENVPINSQAS